MIKVTKAHVTQSLRWAVFVMAALTMGLKIAEAAAYSSFRIILENPDIAVYSTLVNSGYLFFL